MTHEFFQILSTKIKKWQHTKMRKSNRAKRTICTYRHVWRSLMKEFANGGKSRNNFMVFDYRLPEWLLNVHLECLK